jgi:DNA repair photolyase
MASQTDRFMHKGRGALSNEVGRFEARSYEAIDDGWDSLEVPPAPIETTLTQDFSRTIIARNKSPDVPFDRSINPYRGCEHGCVYCFARPSHAYLGLSAGLDFETRLFFKPRAAELLTEALAKPGYRCEPIAMGTNTDPYQPAERQLGITRQILEVLNEWNHPVTIVTKGALVARDIDILADMASRRLATVAISITTLDRSLARTLEPRAATPERRLATVRALADAGIPTAVMAAPMIPALNDSELEAILEAARDHGAQAAGYVLLRLPYEIKDLFADWLETHAPLKAQHVLSLVRETREGALNSSCWGERMRGNGVYADLLAQRYLLALKRLGLERGRDVWKLDTASFRAPPKRGDQLSLF